MKNWIVIAEFVGWIIFDRSRDLARTPLLEPCRHETPRAEPFFFFFLLVLESFAEKSLLESLDSSLRHAF